MKIPHYSEFDHLVNALLAGSITSQEHDRLDRLMLEHDSLRARYLQMTGLHFDLVQLASQSGGPPVGTSRTCSPRLLSIRGARSVFAAASCLLLLVTLTTLWIAGNDSPPSETPIADSASTGNTGPATSPAQTIIAEAAHARFYGHGFAPQTGESIPVGVEHILTHGQVALKFVTDARAVLLAPSVFTITGPETLLLTSGQCSVHAPPGAEGFRVETPSANVVDLGTRFAVGVDVAGETSLHVVEGAASLSTGGRKETPVRLIEKGQSAFVGWNDPLSTVIPVGNQVSYVDQLPDRVVRYEATTDSRGRAQELLSVTVQRAGRTRTYGRDDLVRARLTHVAADARSAVFCTPRDTVLPSGRDRLSLLSDWSLITGIINPRLADPENPEHNDFGIEVEFAPPAVNGPGPDIVLFDLHTLVQDEAGDKVTVVTRDPGRTQMSLDILRFDLDLSSPDALDLGDFEIHSSEHPIDSLDDLISHPMQSRTPTFVRSKALATAIDLSQLGYNSGEAARRIMFQTRSDIRLSIDPVLVVALPSIDD